MGCSTSKPKKKVCKHCQAPYSPVRRSYSVHVHHLPQRQGDSYHMVSLTSSTLGSLKLDTLDNQTNNHGKTEAPSVDSLQKNGSQRPMMLQVPVPVRVGSSVEEFMLGVVEAKAWSRMIDERITKITPKTPTRTPPGEPETINAWDLMEGLEDTSPFRSPNYIRGFSFDVAPSKDQSFTDQPTPRVHDENGQAMRKPLWLENSDNDSNSNDTSIVSEFDPEVISSFRKALEDLPPANPFYLRPLISDKEQTLDSKDQTLELSGSSVKKIDNKSAPRGKDKLIVYFTSLRGVRKTYEDCSSVRVILKGLGAKVDERDVSMHCGFKEELQELLGEGWFNKGSLPKVFVGKKYIGGAEEIKRMHEDGKLEKAIESCEMVDDGGGGGGGGNGGICEACGDIRFVPCDSCCGSCKIYYEGDYEEVYDEAEYGFQRCPDCNENGLIRCPICCD